MKSRRCASNVYLPLVILQCHRRARRVLGVCSPRADNSCFAARPARLFTNVISWYFGHHNESTKTCVDRNDPQQAYWAECPSSVNQDHPAFTNDIKKSKLSTAPGRTCTYLSLCSFAQPAYDQDQSAALSIVAYHASQLGEQSRPRHWYAFPVLWMRASLRILMHTQRRHQRHRQGDRPVVP